MSRTLDTSTDPTLWALGGPRLAIEDGALVLGGGRPAAEAITLRRRRPGAGTDAPPPSDHLSEADLRAIEDTYADGITAVQVVEVFVSRGIRFSEATFRKYVQQGLLPRSRRVGRKGKNKGSLGMYPAKTVRRIDHVKRLMGEGYTIEQIQAQFLQFTDLVENVSEAIDMLFDRLDEDLAACRGARAPGLARTWPGPSARPGPGRAPDRADPARAGAPRRRAAQGRRRRRRRRPAVTTTSWPRGPLTF
jgi:hypothetical protein